jgi:signal transduction histidine kinase
LTALRITDDDAHHALQRHRPVIRTELAKDLAPVIADRVQLQQVILNLLRNAVEAMSTVDDRPRELLIKTELCEGDQVGFSVKDAGVGLPAHAADQIFDAFFTTKNDGMGIGLSVSRSIIESHHGRLWAEKNDGPGSTFSFSIPSRRPVGCRTTKPVSFLRCHSEETQHSLGENLPVLSRHALEAGDI